MKISDLTPREQATVYTIAARMAGMSYGKYMQLLRCGIAKMPPLEEILPQMVKKKDSKATRRVVQYNKMGEYMATYESAADAAIFLDKERCKGGVINNACTGKTNSAYGYQWRFEGDKEPGVYMNRGEMPIRKTKLVDKVCVLCGKPYKGVGRSLYCGKECAEKAKADSRKKYYDKNKPPEEKERVCQRCGKPFIATGKMLYCSERCRNDSNMAAYNARKKAQNRKAGA